MPGRDPFCSDSGSWHGPDPMLSPRQFLAVLCCGVLVLVLTVLGVARVVCWACADVVEVGEGW